MNTKSITLPQFIKTFPKSKSFVKETYVYNYNKDLSYDQKIKFAGRNYKIIEKLAVTDNCIYYMKIYKNIIRKGRSFYPIESYRQTIYIGKNEIGFHKIDIGVLFRFIEILGINWFKDIDKSILYNLFINKTIFRRILTNRIYNEETLYKSAATCIYRIKNISWKTVRKYYKWKYSTNNYSICSLDDLYYFTKNVDKSVDVISSVKNNSIYLDLLRLAIQLNQTVDFNWSIKRISEEHKKQIEISLCKEINEKKTIPIYKTDSIDFPFKLLNNEKDIFTEGKNMHHCLYNCYYYRIKNHDYIAFHLDAPEECTLGIRMNNDNDVVLDQIYKRYDCPVLESTVEYANTFIKEHVLELKSLFSQDVVKDDVVKDNDITES